jgi:hypothetical protein
MLPWQERSAMVMFGAGLLVGFMGSGIAQVRLMNAAWPVYDAIVDWQKVEELATQASPLKVSAKLR